MLRILGLTHYVRLEQSDIWRQDRFMLRQNIFLLRQDTAMGVLGSLSVHIGKIGGPHTGGPL